MIRSFLSLVSLALLSATADAQFLPTVQGTCANGQCGPIQATVQAARSAVAGWIAPPVGMTTSAPSQGSCGTSGRRVLFPRLRALIGR